MFNYFRKQLFKYQLSIRSHANLNNDIKGVDKFFEVTLKKTVHIRPKILSFDVEPAV